VKRAVLVLVVLLAACDSGTAIPTTAAGPTTTTTIENDTCERLAADTADYLEVVIEVLDLTRATELADPERWTEALVAIQQQGAQLDARAEIMECDLVELQAAAFRRARLDPDSPLSHYLLRLWGLEE